MKRINDPDTTPPQLSRRALLQHHDPALLANPEVAAFLDDTSPANTRYLSLARQFIRANEPALLIELIRATQTKAVMLLREDEEIDHGMPLPDGLFGYIAEHINQVPCVTSLHVAFTVLTSACCAQLQTSLNSPDCRLTSLDFSSCSFANAQVQFPTQAPTITAIDWTEDDDQPPPAPAINQMLPALAGWSRLKHVSLISMDAPLDFDVLTRLLRANALITSVYLVSEVVPYPPGDPAHRPQEDPALLFDALKDDHIGVTHLTFQVLDTHNSDFNDHCLQCITHCLLTNTTLELLDVPGISMCTDQFQQRFANSLQLNRSLTALAPLDIFGDQLPAPIRRNKHQRFWFTRDFILGAAEALMKILGAQKDMGTKVTSHLAPSAIERTYCGAAMALLCKATHEGAVKLRSAGLREAILIHIASNDSERCLELVNTLLAFHIDLLPGDKLAVVAHARQHGRLRCLPAGYAG